MLEVGGHTAGGLATRMLADLGADVIKVEMPQGDNSRTTVPILANGNGYLWHFWNVGKRSVVLNLADPDGHAVLCRLVEESDVFLENMALDTIEKLRISRDDLAAVNPGLVYCSVSGFGVTGPRRYRRAFDSVVQAEAGIMSVTGEPGGPPVKAGPSVADNSTALAAVTAVTAALCRRDQTGAGLFIDMALFDTGTWLTAEWWPAALAGCTPVPMGNRHPYHCLYNSFAAADEHLVAITATTPAQEEAARQLFELTAESASWDSAVRDWVSTRSAQDVVTTCVARGISAGLFNDLSSVVQHPLTERRGMVQEIDITPTERCFVIGTPYKFSGEGQMLAPERSVPKLGEHTETVLRDVLGLEDDEREGLRRAGITTPASSASGTTVQADISAGA